MKVGLLPLLIALASGSALAEGCSSAEKVVWQCETKVKSYALCASADAGKTSGYMEYRVYAGSRKEFVFPPRRRPPLQDFTYRLYGRSAAVEFKSGAYKYSIIESISGDGEVWVERDGNRLGVVRCDSSSDTLTLTETMNYLEAIGVWER